MKSNQPKIIRKFLLFFFCVFISSEYSIAQNQIKNKKIKTKYFYTSIRTGFSIEHMKVRGYFQDQINFNKPGHPYLTGAFDVDYDGESILRLELTYRPVKFYSIVKGKELKKLTPYELTGYSIVPEFQLMHKWTLNSYLNIYGGAGFGWRFSTIKKNEMLYDGQPPIGASKSLQLETNGAVVSCASGLFFRKHFELNLKISISQWGNNSQNKLSNSNITVGLGYRL